jgi:hypothetical protein
MGQGPPALWIIVGLRGAGLTHYRMPNLLTEGSRSSALSFGKHVPSVFDASTILPRHILAAISIIFSFRLRPRASECPGKEQASSHLRKAQNFCLTVLRP